MLPSFGAGLRRFLFEPNVPATHRLVEEAVRRAIQLWEPRVRLESVRVSAQTNRHVQVVRPERFAEAVRTMDPKLFDEVVALVRLRTCWTPAATSPVDAKR